MPSYGEKQMSAGKVLNNAKPIVGTRKMKANNSTITPTLGGVENIEYKGNPVLKANRS